MARPSGRTVDRACGAAAVAVALAGLTALTGCGGVEPVAAAAPLASPTTAAPQPPTALTAALADDTVTVSWGRSGDADATGYRLWVDTDEPVDLLGDVLTHELQDLDAGQHLVQLATVTADGISAAATYSFAVPYPETVGGTATAAPATSASAAPVVDEPTTSSTPATPASPVVAPAPAASAAAPATRSRRSITVALDLIQILSYDLTLGEPEPGCDTGGFDGYDDIRIGASVTVRGASGSITGTGNLTNGDFVELPTEALYHGPVAPEDTSEYVPFDEWEKHDFMRGTCTYSGSVEVPTDDFYTIEVNHRGEISVSETDLEADGGVVSTSLG